MNREEWTQIANSNVIEVINNTDGIKFVKFKNTNDLYYKLPSPVTYDIKPWIEIGSTQEYREEEVLSWLLNLIKSEEINGKFVMSWEDEGRRGIPDLVEVILSKNYKWVSPLWSLGKGLYIHSFERGYAWSTDIFEDRYSFLKIKLKEIEKK